MTLHVTFNPQSIGVNARPPTASVDTGTPVARSYEQRPAYEGSYVATPSAEAQVLETKNLRMTDNVTVNPIPSNYGLITWNGSVLTVS